MHEFPEVQVMIRHACAQAPAERRIKRLRIVVGEASGRDPRHIKAHFAEASRGTPAEDVVLEFIHEKLVAKCAACGAEFKSSDSALACIRCGGTKLVITAGKDVRLIGIEAGS